MYKLLLINLINDKPSRTQNLTLAKEKVMIQFSQIRYTPVQYFGTDGRPTGASPRRQPFRSSMLDEGRVYDKIRINISGLGFRPCT